jgi:hypothetical protein
MRKTRHFEATGTGIEPNTGGSIDDFNDTPRAWFDNHMTAVDDRIPMLPQSILRRGIIISNALLRQHRPHAHLFSVSIGRVPLTNGIFPETRTGVDTKDAADRARRCADGASDDGSDGTAYRSPLSRSGFRTGNSSLS